MTSLKALTTLLLAAFFPGLLMDKNDSCRTMLENMGIAVDCPTIEYNKTTYYKGLAFREQCIDFFTNRLTRALTTLTYY